MTAVILTASCASGDETASTTTTNADADADADASKEISGVETFTVANRNHVDGPVNYPQNPPVGGDHAPNWQNCGYYSSAIADENAVHSLEHGAVWVTYSEDLDPDQVEVLRALAKQPYTLVSPRADLPAPVVASAWGKQLRVESAEDPRLARFLTAFRQGPQTPEPGAVCTGALGEPE